VSGVEPAGEARVAREAFFISSPRRMKSRIPWLDAVGEAREARDVVEDQRDVSVVLHRHALPVGRA
jgi:hypothetical protein